MAAVIVRIMGGFPLKASAFVARACSHFIARVGACLAPVADSLYATSMSAPVPVPAFEGIDNFRDFGGYAAADGRRIRRGQLYRSAHHGRASDADLIALGSLGLETIVDLRRPEERQREPGRRWAPFGATVIENDVGEDPADAYEAYMRTADLTVETMRAFLVDYYSHAPMKARHVELYARYFKALGEGGGPVLIHCAAGKDRTGVLAALTHHLLGVAYDDSLADYLLTNDLERIERRMPLFAQYVQDQTGRRPSEAFMRASLGVEALYLDTAFAAIKARYGSIDAYLEQGLGVDAAMKAEIAHHLLEWNGSSIG
jgi:protein-tyrosine phosphatase